MSQSVSKWLESLGLGQYSASFEENDINYGLLARLTNDDLKELGVGSLGHRKTILEAASHLSDVPPGSDNSGSQPDPVPSATDDAERRQLTVMFCDLADSTLLSQKLDVEIMRNINRGYQDMCKSAIERYDGYLAKYMGDGVLAYFGYPNAGEDDAERAVFAGLNVVSGMQSLNTHFAEAQGVTLGVRIGIATGLVVAGDLIGEGASRENPVVGTTPNLAARIQGSVPVNTVAISQETYNLAAGYFDFRDGGELQLKGIEHPVQVWHAIAPAAVKSRFEANQNQTATPLVGREEEIQTLLRRWEMSRNGEGQVILLSGEAGIGKSRLCETVQEHTHQYSANQLLFQCSPHHSGDALYPVIAHLEQSAGITPGMSPRDKLNRLESFLEHTSGNFKHGMAAIANLLSISEDLLGEKYSKKLELHKDNTLNIIAQWLSDLAVESPLVCVFEDLHWADPSTIELLNIVIDQAESQKLLLFITFRPEFAAPWIGRAHVYLMALNRLTRAQSSSIIESRAGKDTISQGELAEILSRTDGIPLFIEELTHAVIESLESKGSDGSGNQSTMVPATLRDSLMARLDRLHNGKHVAQCGAVIGREFAHQLLLAISDLGKQDLEAGIEELIQSGIVTRRGTDEDPRYVYKHALLQDAAYSSLLKSRRGPLHRKIAKEILNQTATQPALVAHHWEQAGELELAITCRITAAEQSAINFALSESISNYRIALQLMDRLEDSKTLRTRYLETVMAMLSVKSTFWENEHERIDGLRFLDKALEIATQNKDSTSVAELKANKGSSTGDEELLKDSIEVAKISADTEVQASVTSNYASFLGMRGRYEDSHQHTARSISIFEEIGEPIGLAWAMIGAGRCFSARAGLFDEAIRYSEKTRKIAESAGDPKVTSWLVMETEPLLYKGMWSQTIEVAEKYLPTAYENEQWDAVLWASSWAAIACVKTNRLDDAQKLLNQPLEDADCRVGYYSPRVFNRLAQAYLQIAQGNLDEASQNSGIALEFCEYDENIPLELGASYRVRGMAHSASGNSPEADACFRDSITALEKIQSRPELAQTFLEYGRFKLCQDNEHGRELCLRSLSMFEEMGADGWIEEARSALSVQ